MVRLCPTRHPCPVIGYVLHGAVRMQVKGGPEALYQAGDSFYEAPNGIHLVSKNASATRTGHLSGLLYLRSFRPAFGQSANQFKARR